MEDELELQFGEWELDEAKGKRPVHEALQSDSEGEAEQDGVLLGVRGSCGDRAECASGSGCSATHKCRREEQEEGGEVSVPPASPRGSEAGDLTCAICLNSIPLENMALVKGCDHMYCATCILHWALHKEEPWCPQCKQPFAYLLTYRGLDGILHDFPCEEPVTLLKRARWFEEHLRFVDHSSASLIEESRLADQMAWQEYAGDYDLAEDEEIESFYFSSAAGRARVLLGNRRHGEGGFISGGRRQARPAPVVDRKRGGKAKAGKGGERAPAAAGLPPVPPPTAMPRTPNAGGGRNAQPGSCGVGVGAGTSSAATPVPADTGGADMYGSSPGSASGCALFGSSPSGSGRRARRNARRAALDAGIEAAGSWGR
ncbi:hypothetical protein D9Q98_002744 [Chlorella vulgaris]|uniref:RING-type domain-containing protein n=1 Tax=Chlorella vulgaris TaxID=3077 RepID=A0A9D4Z014_CHLVU|nr:hypothetical protein D9Q98_002744 [Chlorella vulgaris]